MAVLKSEIIQNMAQPDPNRSTYEAIVTSEDDLAGEECVNVYGIGSVVLCLENQTIYIKGLDEEWRSINSDEWAMQ